MTYEYQVFNLVNKTFVNSKDKIKCQKTSTIFTEVGTFTQ